MKKYSTSNSHIQEFQVFIDNGDDLGTKTIATFDTKKEAECFIHDYLLKYPKSKLNIDTLTNDYTKNK